MLIRKLIVEEAYNFLLNEARYVGRKGKVSAHPQGGNPMSDDKKLGAVNSHFRVHGFDNLFVCGASIFPVSIVVNPQLTIMAMADYASEIITGA